MAHDSLVDNITYIESETNSDVKFGYLDLNLVEVKGQSYLLKPGVAEEGDLVFVLPDALSLFESKKLAKGCIYIVVGTSGNNYWCVKESEPESQMVLVLESECLIAVPIDDLSEVTPNRMPQYEKEDSDIEKGVYNPIAELDAKIDSLDGELVYNVSVLQDQIKDLREEMLAQFYEHQSDINELKKKTSAPN